MEALGKLENGLQVYIIINGTFKAVILLNPELNHVVTQAAMQAVSMFG